MLICFTMSSWLLADPRGRVVHGVGVRQLACWDCTFQSCRGCGCLSAVRVLGGRIIHSEESYRVGFV